MKPIVKRLVGCTGSIQLTTAVTVLRHRESSDFEYQNYLVIYNLSSSNIHTFVQTITDMAKLLLPWEKITFLSEENLYELKEFQKYNSFSHFISRVCALTGLKDPDELYLNLDWLSGNELLSRCYPSTYKICYGDGIGIYTSKSSKVFAPQKSRLKVSLNVAGIIYGFSQLKSQVLACFQKPSLLEDIEFNKGFFSYPDAFGEVPDFTFEVLKREQYLQTFLKLKNLVENSPENYLFSKLSDYSDIAILLTSNFSEIKRMHLRDEIEAYVQFIGGSNLSNESLIYLKPHPRDSKEKIEALRLELLKHYAEVIPLVSPGFFCLPFEVIFSTFFVQTDGTIKYPVKVFSVSSACVSFPWLFKVPCDIGFGSTITKKYFNQDFITSRLEHEKQLLNMMNSSAL